MNDTINTPPYTCDDLPPSYEEILSTIDVDQVMCTEDAPPAYEQIQHTHPNTSKLID